MKLALALAVVALFMIGTAVSADTVTVPLYPGFNMIAPPLAPMSDAAPATVFSGLSIQGKLFRFDAPTQSYVFYDPDFPEDYGGVLLGDGTWLKQTASATWSYTGFPDGIPDGAGQKTDMWISLPATGFTLIGHPFNHVVDLANCLVTDGTQTIGWNAAVGAGKVQAALFGYDGVSQSYFTVGTDPDSYDRTQLEPGSAYWLKTNVNNLAVIIPA